jgi:TonB family protein
VAGASARIGGEILLKSGERTSVEFITPAAGGALRGKTSLGDYSIALDDVAAINPVATVSNRPVDRADGAAVPGKGVTYPQALRQVRPQYTSAAMKAKIQGAVLVECVVLPNGTVGSARVVKSLDATFGLDDEAVKAAKQWRFQPGTRDGVPVPVAVTIELTFTLGR